MTIEQQPRQEVAVFEGQHDSDMEYNKDESTSKLEMILYEIKGW